MSKFNEFNEFKTWRITAVFYTPCIYYTPVLLDGLLAYALNRRQVRAEGRPSYCGPGWDRNFVLDEIARYIGHEADCALCTQMLPDTETLIIESIKKRLETRYQHMIEFGKSRRRISNQAAPYRNYDKKMPGRLVGRGHWDFIGDGPAALDLLQAEVVGIGRDVTAGYGWVSAFELSCPPERGVVGILARRPVPVALAERYGITGKRQVRAWRPPYWDSRNLAECVAP